MPQTPVKMTIDQARQARSEGVEFRALRDDKGELIGWKAKGDESIANAEFHAPIETFQWVPHEPKTWPWRYATLLKGAPGAGHSRNQTLSRRPTDATDQDAEGKNGDPLRDRP